MNSYETYKPSGIEWIGDIPEYWEVKRFKYLIDLINESTDKNLPKIGLENIESWTGKFLKTDSNFVWGRNTFYVWRYLIRKTASLSS